jgi:hypothetical protein
VSDVFPLYYEQPFESEVVEKLYQEMKVWFDDDDMDPMEMFVFGLLSYERYMRGMPGWLPPIDLPLGWTLVQAEYEVKPFSFAPLEELYQDLVANSGDLGDFELTLFYFLSMERNLRNRPRYEFVPPEDFASSFHSDTEDTVVTDFFENTMGYDENDLVEWENACKELQDFFTAVAEQQDYQTDAAMLTGSEAPVASDGAVPEPMTLLLVATGVGLIAFRRKFSRS